MTTPLIPCKRPKVDLSLIAPNMHGHRAICRVPGCGWAYPTLDSRNVAVKSDAQQQATAHRQAHRAAVPRAWIERDVEYDVHCQPCGGHRRTFGTRVDAQAWLDHHLSTEHGLVTCP